MDTRTSGVARTLKKLRTSKGDYCIKQRLSKITSLFKMGIPLKGKNLLPKGDILFFKSSSLRYGKSLYQIRWAPLTVTILLSTCAYCVMGATPMRTLNPFKPSVLFVGHRQTVQNQASDQVVHCLLAECSIKIWLKMKTTNQHPLKQKWTVLIDKGGKSHSA